MQHPMQPNDERSRAGPRTSGKQQCDPPVSAGAIGWTISQHCFTQVYHHAIPHLHRPFAIKRERWLVVKVSINLPCGYDVVVSCGMWEMGYLII